MPDGDREYVGGWLVVEDHRLPWNGGIADHDVKIVGCGEIGHVRWQLFRIAWREVVKRDLELAMKAYAQRVGVE